jgi:hypothetical protein
MDKVSHQGVRSIEKRLAVRFFETVLAAVFTLADLIARRIGVSRKKRKGQKGQKGGGKQLRGFLASVAFFA